MQRNRHRRRHRLLFPSLAVVTALVLSSASAGDPDNRTAKPRRPVLVELFTSQGCSSCPSADSFLEQLSRVQPVRSARIIVISQHVDYWNDLGWNDPFSDAAFTLRQREYGAFFGNRSVYTPQMVVDGGAELVGSDQEAALRAIARAAARPKSEVALSRSGGGKPVLGVKIPPTDLPDDVLDVWLAITEDHLATEVAHGENRGRRLGHVGVARRIQHLGALADGGFSRSVPLALETDWNPVHLDAVVFVQEREGRAIRGVASLSLGD